ncbi:class I SAM-dependent methyltransferase [Sphingobium phenoxybenzoativorans]|uniref:class I SAM-dependent methyltransferase n=1 Tax=Sphingobium phenoxybenzoativorans TaxID=1592790 RepID=UPI0008720A2E|nr:class I SAM-dependent methyltransferase [Sphingobium phenoxybenzoativorans]
MNLALDERSRLDFVLTLRRRWADTLFPALREQVEADDDKSDMRAATRRQPAYPWFAFVERASQKMLWRDVADAIGARPPARHGHSMGPAELTLDPAMHLPDWYTDWDIHLQPGGVWRADSSADIYELGAKLVMLGDNDDYTFHRSFIETAIPDRHYGRIADLGCGFGKSTWPLKRRFPDAEVVGIDLAAPCLRLAYDRANAAGLAIEFRQADCQATGLADSSVNLVTSTMLIHEIPRPALIATLAECARILAPGGLLRFLDFTRTGDAFRDFAMMEHGERNNEPFMPGLLTADVPALCAEAGLINARWTAFDERGGGRLPESAWPERPEWHFPWAVLEAEKSA